VKLVQLAVKRVSITATGPLLQLPCPESRPDTGAHILGTRIVGATAPTFALFHERNTAEKVNLLLDNTP
jgi:hypothetical protein